MEALDVPVFLDETLKAIRVVLVRLNDLVTDQNHILRELRDELAHLRQQRSNGS